jgi:hypothetical protein
VADHDLWTLVVNDRSWPNSFDELGPIGCEQTGAISVAVRKGDKWAIVRNGKIITGWFAALRGWAINPESTYLAAAVADEQSDRTLLWKVMVLPLTQ